MKLGILQFSSGSLGMGERIIPDGHLRNCASTRDTTWTRVRLWWSATSFQGFSASETFLRPNKSLVLWGYYSQPDDYEPIFQEVGSFFADWEFRCWSIMVNFNIDSILTHTHMTWRHTSCTQFDRSRSRSQSSTPTCCNSSEMCL
jgi:hypothetical protein